MDNFFDILIVLFFVGSLLAPLFKKKKEEQRSKYENPNMPRQRAPEPVNEKSSDDLLSELEELFGKKKETQPQMDSEHTPIITSPESPQRDSEVDYDLDRSYDSAPSLETEISRRQSEIDRINRETRDIIASAARTRKEASEMRSEFQFKQTSKAESLNAKGSSSGYSRKRLLNDLRNPETLKDFIIISELIGKPKALKHSR